MFVTLTRLDGTPVHINSNFISFIGMRSNDDPDRPYITCVGVEGKFFEVTESRNYVYDQVSWLVNQALRLNKDANI